MHPAPPLATPADLTRGAHHSPTWHVIIGTNYGSHVVHATKHRGVLEWLGQKRLRPTGPKGPSRHRPRVSLWTSLCGPPLPVSSLSSLQSRLAPAPASFVAWCGRSPVQGAAPFGRGLLCGFTQRSVCVARWGVVRSGRETPLTPERLDPSGPYKHPAWCVGRSDLPQAWLADPPPHTRLTRAASPGRHFIYFYLGPKAILIFKSG